MKEMVKIRYRSVIDHGNDKISDFFESEAIHEWQISKEVWQINHSTQGMISIELTGNRLCLRHGHSCLKMYLGETRSNEYQTAYGTLWLDAYLKKLEKQRDSLKIVYYLGDHGHIISKCYLTIDVISMNLS